MFPDPSWKAPILGFLATGLALFAEVQMRGAMLALVVGGLVLYACLLIGLRVILRSTGGPHDDVHD